MAHRDGRSVAVTIAHDFCGNFCGFWSASGDLEAMIDHSCWLENDGNILDELAMSNRNC